ncbi:MAG: hypothetical protein RJA92_1730, partial [Bacteroidota bacterium]
MRGKLFNIKNLLLTIFIVGSIFYAPHANGQAATMTTNITTVCSGDAPPYIKFAYTGTGNEGVAPYTFTYKINDGTDVTLTTVTGDTVSIPVPTNIAGTFKYTLISVSGSAATAQLLSTEITFIITAAPTMPNVQDTFYLCNKSTRKIISSTTGGIWSSSNSDTASINSDGEITAKNTGRVAIYYTVTENGCSSTKLTTVTVFPIPVIGEITGSSDVCIGSITTFSSSTLSGIWSSTSSNIASITSGGIITGVSAGNSTITYAYTDAQTGCYSSTSKIITVLDVPTVGNITGTFTLCKGNTTNLASISSINGVWSSNLTGIATVDPNSGVVTGVSAGTATISYTVTGLNGCSKTVSQAVVVSAPTVNPISVTATTVCVGGTITATSTTSSGTWTTTNAGIATINSSGVVTGVAAGTASIVYTVTSGGCSNSATIGISVFAQPTPSFSFTDNPCSGSSVAFTSSVSGTSSYTYSWNFGDGTATSNLQNPSHTFTSLGCGTATFNVTLTVTDANGCSNSVVNTITVKQQPDISYRDTKNSTRQFDNCGFQKSVANNYIITLDKTVASVGCVSNYTVDWGDGSTPETVSLPYSHTYTSAGIFNLIVTANGSNGCNISKTIIVKNIANPGAGLANPGNTAYLCAPTAPVDIQITNWGNNLPGTKYQVDYGDGTKSIFTQEEMVASSYYNAGNPSASVGYPVPHIYTIATCPSNRFQVELNVISPCGTTPAIVFVGPIFAKSVPNFTVAPKVCVGSSITFTNSSTTGNAYEPVLCAPSTNYFWNFGDGSAVVETDYLSSPQNISHTYTAAGTYSVTLTTESYCNTSTKVQTICVEPTVLTPAFTLDTQEGCGPLTVNATNGTNASNSCPSPPTFLWEVTYASGFC